MNIEATDLESGVNQLNALKRYQPFRFSGVWHLAVINGNCKAYRNKRDLLRCAAKHGLQSIAIATL